MQAKESDRRLEPATRAFLFGALLGAIAAAAAAAAVFFLVAVPGSTLLDELLDAHLRALMPAHLIDVVSNDPQTVKPWFAAHADATPAFASFERQGYLLSGGRVDYVAHQRAAVLVYQYGTHVIDVFSWAANGGRTPGKTTRSGYHLLFWSDGARVQCAVSDAGWPELQALAALLKRERAHERQRDQS